jgi:23S rRNA-/tRNA-specific pseudouridylate synthase
MPAPTEFTLTRQENSQPLVQILRNRLSISGKQAKSLLDRRNVFVNDTRVWMAKHVCRTGDTIRVGGSETAAPLRLEILSEGPTLVAVNKPPGRVSDRDPASVEALLRSQLNRPDLRALHRLDKDTSGLLLFTPGNELRNPYLDLFRQRAIEKTYRLILRGDPGSREPVVRSRLDGREAVTRFQILSRNRAYAEALCRIPTGRKHQIRRHLRQLNCTLAGDREYNTRERIPRVEQDFPRQMLHAESLTFPCPITGKEIRLHAPPPADFQKARKKLGLG